MAWLKKNRLGIWQVIWDDPATKKRVQRSTGVKDKATARKVLAEWEAKLEAGSTAASVSRSAELTLDDAWTHYLRLCDGRNDPRTPARVSCDWRLLRATFPSLSLLRQITPDVLEQFRLVVARRAKKAPDGISPEQARLWEERASRSWNSRRRRLRAIWGALIRARVYQGANPWEVVRPNGARQCGHYLERILTLQEVDALFERAGQVSNDFRLFCQLGYYSGLRHGEILGLRWQDVQWGENGNATTITVGVKLGHRRTIEICRTLEAILRDRRGLPHVYVVAPWAALDPTREGNPYRPYRRHDFRTAWRNACIDLGLRRPDGGTLQIHDLRHSYASHLAQAGTPLLEITRLLGHTSASITQRYVHLGARNVAAVLDTLRSTDRPR